MPAVAVGQAEVAYAVSGEGPGLVLVHGTGGSAATTWSHLTKQLADRWTLVMPDLPGSGATVDAGGPLELADLATQVGAAATAAGLERYAVLGFSLGAAVAAALAAAEPERVEALVMVAGVASGTNARAHLQFDLWRDLSRLDAGLFARLWMLSGFSPRFVGELPVQELARAATFPIAPGIDRQCELNTRIDLSDVLGDVRAPALVIGCADDWIAPPAAARALAAQIPGARYVEMETGHFAILEAPQAFLEHVRSFLLATQLGGAHDGA